MNAQTACRCAFDGNRVNLLTFDLPAQAAELSEPLAGAAADFQQSARQGVSQKKRAEFGALACQSRNGQQQTVEAVDHSGSFDRFVLVREIILIGERQILRERHGIEPEKSAGRVGALADVPEAGRAKEAVGEPAVESASLALAKRTTRAVAGANGAIIHQA